MMVDLEHVESIPPDIHTGLKVGVGVAIGAFAIFVVTLLVVIWSTIANQADLNQIREQTITESLVEEWVIQSTPTDQVVEIGGEAIQFTGLFVCTDEAIELNPIVQFRASFSDVGPGGLEVPRPLRPPREISNSCSMGYPSVPVEFEAPWDTQVVDGMSSITEPTEFVMIFSVEADGWVGATTTTDPFILVPSSE
jgi:hypothetical protein